MIKMPGKRVNPLMEQEKRKAEMDKLVKQAQGIESSKKTKLTLSMSEEDINMVKKLAIDRKTSVSALFHDWIVANAE